MTYLQFMAWTFFCYGVGRSYGWFERKVIAWVSKNGRQQA